VHGRLRTNLASADAAAFSPNSRSRDRGMCALGNHPMRSRYLSILAALVALFLFGNRILLRDANHSAGVWLSPALVQHARCMVAIAAGKATARGEILNDLPDRISDIVIFVGVATAVDESDFGLLGGNPCGAYCLCGNLRSSHRRATRI